METIFSIFCILIFLLGIGLFDVTRKLNLLSSKVDSLIKLSTLEENIKHLHLNINKMKEQISRNGGGAPRPSPPPPKPS